MYFLFCNHKSFFMFSHLFMISFFMTTQPNGCIISDMFYLDKLDLVEKGNVVLAEHFFRSKEHCPKIVTNN